MLWWIEHIRRIVYGVAILVAIAIFAWILTTIPPTALRTIRATQSFAFTALIFLYFALLASPLYAVFPHAPLRILYIKARKAIGNSAFFFALAHGSLAFFGELGGFPGLRFLNQTYIIGISLSATALFILGVMALTSLSYFERALGRWWKRIHRFVYLAGVLIIVHALLLGEHFQDLSKLIPQIAFTAVFFLLALEALRFHRYYTKKFPGQRYLSIAFFSILGILAGIYFLIHIPSAKHIHLIRDPQSGTFTFLKDTDRGKPSSLSRGSQFLGSHSWHLLLFGLPFVIVFGIHFRDKWRERKKRDAAPPLN